MTLIYFASPEWAAYEPHLPAALKAAGIDAEIQTTAERPEDVDYILYAPNGPLQDFAPFSRAKAVFSLWAGVEKIIGNQSLTQPLCRMVDPGLSESMVEYVTAHALRAHLGLDAHITRSEPGWDHRPPPLARERVVAMLGLGELGLACARQLQSLNFRVKGWSRSPKQIAGLESYHGDAGLGLTLEGADIIVTLLPKTPGTENILNATSLARAKRGAAVINPGRGPLIDDEALLAALDSGQIGHATLDVFRVEPLPADHPYWAHPNVTVTPHIAADTRPASASLVLAENLRRAEAGEPLLNLVDRLRGY